jgi:hypothetical protein
LSAEVELLREAATLMKILAANTTEGRWEFGTSSTVYMNGTGVYYQRVAGVPGIKGTLSMFKTDAEHMIAWDPAVARSVAALLERAANGYETKLDMPECAGCDDEECTDEVGAEFHVTCNQWVDDCQCLAPFVVVARKFLRREAGAES